MNISKEKLDQLNAFDLAAERTGGYIEKTAKLPSYNIQEMHKWCIANNRNIEILTEDERNQFKCKKIWLIRRGESIANAGAATQDHIIIPLSQKGQEQAKQISLLIPYHPDLIITSPFARTEQTAAPTLNRFPGARHEVWEVQEFTYLSPPTCIGTTAAERHERVNEYWERLDPDYVDGEGAESFRTFISRAKAASDRLSRLSNGLVLMFTHAQFIRAVRLLHDTDERDIKKVMNHFKELPRVENCEITKWEG